MPGNCCGQQVPRKFRKTRFRPFDNRNLVFGALAGHNNFPEYLRNFERPANLWLFRKISPNFHIRTELGEFGNMEFGVLNPTIMACVSVVRFMGLATTVRP